MISAGVRLSGFVAAREWSRSGSGDGFSSGDAEDARLRFRGEMEANFGRGRGAEEFVASGRAKSGISRVVGVEDEACAVGGRLGDILFQGGARLTCSLAKGSGNICSLTTYLSHAICETF